MADILRKQGRTIGSSGGSGGGGLTEEEHDWLESLAAYEPNMHDINPNLVGSITLPETFSFEVLSYSSHWYYIGSNKIPVCGYKRIKAYGNTNMRYRFQLLDGSFSSDFAATNGWSDWIDIPENAIAFCISHAGSGQHTMVFSLSTSES